MTPILYPSTETAFASNGRGMLSSAVSCIVTEERNGAYDLEMRYPVSGIHFEDISLRSIILAKPNITDEPQPFRVYDISKPMAGIVTVSAHHISYDMSGVPVQPFAADSVGGALLGLETNAVIDHPFTFWTDKDTAARFEVKLPSSMRANLGGQAGSVLDAYGGEWQYDRFTARLWNRRGYDRGVTIRYGKNLIDLEQEENCASVYTGVYPFYASAGGEIVQLPERVVYAEGTYDFVRIMPLDLSSEYESPPTEEQLRGRAASYIKSNNIGVPRVSLKISFVQLEQAEEYKRLALLERVSLCDTVSVEFAAMGVSAKAKCVKTTFDVLLNKYESVELGEARTNIADTIAGQQAAIRQAGETVTTAMQAAINNATALITGNKGGYVILHSSTGAREPDEVLIMDTPDIKTAVKVWRWNKSGLGYSSTGYNGPYGTAITQDGAIVADYITAGGMNAARITAGILTSQDGRVQFDLTAGTMTIKDSSGTAKFAFDKDGNLTITGTINASKGSIGGWLIEQAGLYTGSAASPALYLGTAGVAATIAGASRTGLVFKAGNNFGVDSGGNLFANNATLTGGTFSGSLSAASGTFKGSLEAATGTFSGNLSAAGGTFKGDLSAAGGTFSGDLSAAGGTFSGDLSAAGGTFSGELAAATGTFETLDAVGGLIHFGSDFIEVNGIEIGYVPGYSQVCIIPPSADTGNVGSKAYPWNNIVATYIWVDGVSIGPKLAELESRIETLES